jgi:hypothetical protein
LGCSLKNDRTVQVFRSIKQGIEQKFGDIVIPQHFAIEQAPDTEQALSDRNAYLLGLGITGIWFERGQFECVEGMLRLARNELRYRGVLPGATLEVTRPNSYEARGGAGVERLRRFWSQLFGTIKRALWAYPFFCV